MGKLAHSVDRVVQKPSLMLRDIVTLARLKIRFDVSQKLLMGLVDVIVLGLVIQRLARFAINRHSPDCPVRSGVWMKQ